MTVVKVGGSLYDHPALGPGLRAYLRTIPGLKVLIPGGGAVANAVRALDRVHSLGDVAAHWIALRSLAVTADFLAHLVDGLADVEVPDVYTFAAADDHSPDALPHSWDVTSDSLAARMAKVRGASRLVLLKSVAIPPGTPWNVVAQHGGVDPHFPTLAQNASFTIEAVDFRAWLDQHA